MFGEDGLISCPCNVICDIHLCVALGFYSGDKDSTGFFFFFFLFQVFTGPLSGFIGCGSSLLFSHHCPGFVCVILLFFLNSNSAVIFILRELACFLCT